MRLQTWGLIVTSGRTATRAGARPEVEMGKKPAERRVSDPKQLVRRGAATAAEAQ